MSVFTAHELEYLTGERRLARVATVGRDGMPHVVPSGFSYDPTDDVLELRGIDLARTKKFRDARRSGRVAVMVDDVLPPWRPRGVEVRGTAEVRDGADPVIRVHPVRIVSWGLEGAGRSRNARDVGDHDAPADITG